MGLMEVPSIYVPAKLVNITPMSLWFMILIQELYLLAFTNKLMTGAPYCSIYKAYLLGLNFREYPHKIGQKYGTNVPPFQDPGIPIDENQNSSDMTMFGSCYGGWLRNPAPLDLYVFSPLFIGFQPSRWCRKYMENIWKYEVFLPNMFDRDF